MFVLVTLLIPLGNLGFTWVMLQQPEKQHYPILPVCVVFQCLPGYGCCNHKSSAKQACRCMQRFGVYLGKDTAALPSFAGVRGVSVFAWVQLLQPQEQC